MKDLINNTVNNVHTVDYDYMTDEEYALIGAVLYALGRNTYIVARIINHAISKSAILSNMCRNILIEEIEEYDKDPRLGLGGFGSCNTNYEGAWKKLVYVLKGGVI